MFDTSKCYGSGSTDFRGINAKIKGCLLKINVPAGTNYYERIMSFDFAPTSYKSEIILNPSKFRIDRINNSFIEMTMI